MCVHRLANYLNPHHTNYLSLADLKSRNLSKLLFKNFKNNIKKNQKRSIHSAFNATARLKTKFFKTKPQQN